MEEANVMSDPNANPLIAPLLALLQQAAGSYKVHELMAALRQQGAIPQLADDEQLQLFRVNFLIMNALYQLQTELYEEGWCSGHSSHSIPPGEVALCLWCPRCATYRRGGDGTE